MIPEKYSSRTIFFLFYFVNFLRSSSFVALEACFSAFLPAEPQAVAAAATCCSRAGLLFECERALG